MDWRGSGLPVLSWGQEKCNPLACHEDLAPVKHRKQSRTLKQMLQDAGISGIKHPSHPDNSVWPPQVSATYCSHLLYFIKMIFLFHTQSQRFEHFEITPCSNLGPVVSLPHLSLQLFGFYPVFSGFGGFLSVGLRVFWKSKSTEQVSEKYSNC